MEVPPEERFNVVAPVLKEIVGRTAKAVDKKFGSEGHNLLRKVMREIGSETGEMMKVLSPGEDFKSVGTFFAGAANIFGVDNEV